jgi:hypothetical protein
VVHLNEPLVLYSGMSVAKKCCEEDDGGNENGQLT